MELPVNILLLAVLFVAGLVNLFIYFPTKKISAFFRSLSISQQKPPLQRAAVVTVTSACKEKQISPATTTTQKAVDLKKVFGTFDKNNDGYITKEELIESLKNIRILMTEKEVEEMFRGVDFNGDGLIDFEEFCVLGERLMVDEDEDLKEAFGIFDKDKDGLISVDELGLVLSSLGLKEEGKIDNCKEMIRKVDLDGDGMVNFDEFKMMMRTGVSLISS